MTAKHLFVAGLLAAGAAAGAQTLKPGLWQITQNTQGSGQLAQAMTDMGKQMAAMPPEQRKMMQEMLAKQGVQMGPAGAGGGMSVKVCMTKEMVERNAVPSQQGDCKTTQQSRSGNTMKVAFACTNPPSRGEGEVTMAGPEAYGSKMSVTTTVDGKPQKMDIHSTGKWLGADCGAVEPMAVPKK